MRKVKFLKGNIYHIFNRGTEKREIFLDDSDRWRFLQGMFLFNNKDASANLLWQIAREKGKVNFPLVLNQVKHKEERDPLVRIMADCLMPNHYHLLIEEIREGGISSFMHKLGLGYSKYFNKKNKRTGSLYEGPFKAVAVKKELYLQYLLIYLNVINPGQLIEPELKEKGVKNIENIMKFAREYPWSTNQEYLNKRKSIIIDKGILGEFFSDSKKYEDFARDILLSKKFELVNHIIFE